MALRCGAPSGDAGQGEAALRVAQRWFWDLLTLPKPSVDFSQLTLEAAIPGSPRTKSLKLARSFDDALQGIHADAVVVYGQLEAALPLREDEARHPVGDLLTDNRAGQHEAALLQHLNGILRAVIFEHCLVVDDQRTGDFLAELESGSAVAQAPLKVLGRHVEPAEAIEVDRVLGVVNLDIASLRPVAGVDPIDHAEVLVIGVNLGALGGEMLFDLCSLAQRITATVVAEEESGAASNGGLKVADGHWFGLSFTELGAGLIAPAGDGFALRREARRG